MPELLAQRDSEKGHSNTAKQILAARVTQPNSSSPEVSSEECGMCDHYASDSYGVAVDSDDSQIQLQLESGEDSPRTAGIHCTVP